MDKNILGRGLSAIFNELQQEQQINRNVVAIELPLASIYPNKNQPRKVFNDAEMQELIASVRKDGVLQPILVRRVQDDTETSGSRYEIIAGERRWRAATALNLGSLPAVIVECSEETALQLSLVENLQRHNLSAIEEAMSIQRLISEFNKTQEEVAAILSKSRSYVANTLRLLRLPASVQELVQNQSISAGHARALLDASDPEKLAAEIIRDKLSVRDVERKKKQRSTRALTEGQPDEDLAVLEKSLAQYFQLRARIVPNGNGGGFIQLFFRSYEDLDAFLDKVTGV